MTFTTKGHEVAQRKTFVTLRGKSIINYELSYLQAG